MPRLKHVGVEAGGRRQRVDRAGLRIHDDRGGAALPHQPLMGGDLQFGIDGQRHLAAAIALVARQFADHPAIGIDLDLAGAGGAAQILVVDFLDAAFTDLESGQAQDRLILVQLLFADRADIADQMRRLIDHRVGANLADIDDDAGKIGRVYLDHRDLVPGQVLAHRHRHEAAAIGDLVPDALEFARPHLDDPRQYA